jgi:DNA-binding IclR family transcriptional regulator
LANDAPLVAAARPAAPAVVPAAAKTVAIVRRLNEAPAAGLSLAELSVELGITKSHCHNILKTLLQEGWVVFDASRRRYALGARLLDDISRLTAQDSRGRLIHDELVRLSLAARVPCVLTRVEPDGSFIAIDKAEAAAELLVSVPIGFRFPSDAPAQMRAYLAFAPPTVRQAALAAWEPVAHTPAAIVDRQALTLELEATRARGYAVSRGEYIVGVMSLAAPIKGRSGDVAFVLQCPGVQADIERREQDIAALLLQTASRIAELQAHGSGARMQA